MISRVSCSAYLIVGISQPHSGQIRFSGETRVITGMRSR